MFCLLNLAIDDSEEDEVLTRKQVNQKRKTAVVESDEDLDFEDLEDALSAAADDDYSQDKPIKRKPKAQTTVNTPAPKKTAPKQSLQSTVSGTEEKKRQSEVSINEEPSYVDEEDVVIGGGFSSMDDIREARPYFIKEDQLKDSSGRRPTDPEYDDTTLHIPAGEWKNFTPCMRQYWELKTTNYEKILLFKLGKFYEIFYNDAIIC